jgi:hypothetical protein
MATKRTLIAIGGGLGVASVSLAMAATLGGITDENLGADTTIVASCDTDGVSVDFNTAFDAAAAKMEVVTIDVSGINAACATNIINLGLANADGSSSAEATQGTLDNSGAITLTIPNGSGGASDFRVGWV